jgi:hypothetical protein
MNIFKINDIIIKMDNYEHQIEHFSVGVAYQFRKQSPPPPTICKMGLVCRHDSSTIFSVPRV